MAQSAFQTDGFTAAARDGKTGRIEMAARLGYGAKGVVYATVGVLVLMAALGFARGELTGTRGALEALNNASWGGLALSIIAAGLIGFALWRAVQAFKDPDDKGSDAIGLARRGGLLISGGIYASLAFYAIKLLLDMDAAGSGSSTGQRANEVMAQDGGALFIGILGLCVIGVGLYQMYRALTDQFKKHWQTGEMSAKEERTATVISRVGIGARAIAFVAIGFFLAWAAWSGQPDKAQGMSGVLSDLAAQTTGQWLVAAAGAGLICYGLYCLVNALFRQIQVNS